MRFWNSISERESAPWETYTTLKAWTLTSWYGKKIVYASFKNTNGDIIHISDDIIYMEEIELPFTGWLTLWFDASDTDSITENAGNISAWNDKSGNNYHALQSNSSQQASYVTDSDQVDSVIEFNGTSDFFAIEDLAYDGTNRVDGMLVCASFKVPSLISGSNGNRSLLDFDRSDKFNFYTYEDGVGFSFYANNIKDNYAIGSGYNPWEWHIACASYDNSATNDTTIRINGNTELITNNTSNGTLLWNTATRYGFIWDGSEASGFNGSRNNIYYDGKIGEIVYYDEAVNISDIQDIECYLGKKWNINVYGCPSESIPPIASISYDPEATTNGFVQASLDNISEDISITNNNGKGSYLFSWNDSFTFEFQDNFGNTGSTKAQVDWIESNGLPLIPSWFTNEAPIISSHSWLESVNLIVASWATDITTLSAKDNAYNVVGQFWKTSLSGNNRKNINHYELCNPVVVASHRGDVNGEIQRAPRIRSKSSTGFEVKVDNYNNTIGSIETTLDYITMEAWTYDFNNLQVQAWSQTTSNIICNANKNNFSGTPVSFSPTFTTLPSVIHSISTENDSSWVVSWANDSSSREGEPTTTTMGLNLQRSFNSCSHSAENIDYIAFSPWHFDMLAWFEIDTVRSSDSISSVSSTGDPINFSSPFLTPPPVALVSQLWEDGGNGWYGQIHTWWGIESSQLYATTDEDGPSADRNHTQEVFSAVAFSHESGNFLEASVLEYSIAWWADASLFQIDNESGELSFITGKNPLSPEDSDGNNIYEVSIDVCDNHCNSLCDTQNFFVKLETDSPILDFETSWGYTVTEGTWTRVTSEQYEGSYSIESGNHTDNSNSCFETSRTTGNDSVATFWYKVSSESNYDFLEFYVDDEKKAEWSGEIDWTQGNYNISAWTHTFKWCYSKDGSVSNGNDAAWIDYFEVIEDTGSSEAILDFETIWGYTVSEGTWTRVTSEQYEGSYSIESGNHTDNSNSCFERNENITWNNNSIAFWYKVSSESWYDFLEFYVDDDKKAEWSGELDWNQYSYELDAWNYNLKWCYSKDGSVSNGNDSAWIDYVTLLTHYDITEITPVSSPTNNNIPNYTFSSSLTGNIVYSWVCNSNNVNAVVGNNTITFSALPDGTYNDCKLQVFSGAIATNILDISSFIIDTTEPNINNNFPQENDLLPLWNFNYNTTYSDNIVWVNTGSLSISLRKWDGVNWGDDISSVSLVEISKTDTWALYNVSWLTYGKYKIDTSLEDNIGNIAFKSLIFYHDEPEIILSQSEIDIGDIWWNTKNFSQDEFIISVKTLGAPFSLYMTQNNDMTSWLGIIEKRNGNEGFWYDQEPYTSNIKIINDGEQIGWALKNINTNGEKNIYEYKVKYGALVPDDQVAWQYQTTIKFSIILEY